MVSLVLGTAQLGIPYGIANQHGVPSRQEAFRILEVAWDNGIRYFDTAPGYHTEELLGEFCLANNLRDEIGVITKIPALPEDRTWRNIYEQFVGECLARIRADRIHTILFHNETDGRHLINHEEFFHDLLARQPIERVGVSLYDVREVEHLVEVGENLAFQFPLNIVDHRFRDAFWPGCRRIARSVFLQGLLVSRVVSERAAAQVRLFNQRFHNTLAKWHLEPMNVCVEFIKSSNACDFAVVGVDSERQLREILSAWNTANNASIISAELLKELANSVYGNEIDPRTWS